MINSSADFFIKHFTTYYLYDNIKMQISKGGIIMENIMLSGNSLEEQVFLSNYCLEDYDRPSVTADIVAFSIRTEDGDSYRHNNKSKLSLLLVKRGEYPYKGAWALPGGFLRKDETIEECAFREIKEETNLEPISLMPIGVYSDLNRDPRGRIVSNAYLSIISDCNATISGGTDVEDAKWFDISFVLEDDFYYLELKHNDILLRAKLVSVKTIFKKTEFELVENSELAFDHAQIIASAITLLRNGVKDYETVLDFLPETFTLTFLQNVIETIMDISLTPANFRRKISDYVEETEEYVTGVGHRPAKLFKRK